MGKKFTPEEKIANEAAKKAKRRAHTERRKLREARRRDLDAAVLPSLRALEGEGRRVLDAAMLARAEYDQGCSAEIEALRQKHRTGRVPLEEAVSNAAHEYSARNARHHEEERRIDAQLGAEFPDLTGPARFHVSCWTPPS